MADLTEMCHTVRSRTRTAIAKVSTNAVRGLRGPLSNVNISFFFQVREYQGSFASYQYLWTDDR